MTDQEASRLKYVCIHGHFYQPPRENPWLEVLEREDSAWPYHDWNERIHSECYRANAAARQVDEHNHILTLHNNYEFLSFNFGPTLFRWMERHDAWTCRAIVEADRMSCSRLDGHGNAMAQVYNHLIMPLANRRDKVTQVLWGIRDFEKRFGRFPEGMWLAETAVDGETLDVLADAGIKFTVLSPFQAERWRFLDKASPWQDAKDAQIPTGRPYLYRCKNGKSMNLFFYNASLARGIAFEQLLEHSSRLLNGIDGAHEHRPSRDAEPWLVNTATDGESYGHHFKFGDMGLAACFHALEKDPETRIVNYGFFLASFPVKAQVEIVENTAWSCAHGLGRWQDDCGCHIGGELGWNQKWRAPLREAMNHLRDGLAKHYEREMGRLVRDPWQVRNEYIDVLLDREHRAADFVGRHLRPGSSSSAKPRFLQLLEMQRCAMLMFTSCGWFFDEISSLEAVLIMKYAARAIQLAQQTDAPSLEPSFLKILEKAPSNTPHYENGADVYLKKVKPQVVDTERVAANFAIQALARSAHPSYRIYCYEVTPDEEDNLGSNPVPCRYGRLSILDERTRDEKSFLYAVLHFAGLDFRCSVKPYTKDEEYRTVLKDLQKSVEQQNTMAMVRVLDRVFGTDYFSLHETFKDLRSDIATEISRQKLELYSEFQRHLYQVYRPIMQSLKQWGVTIPGDLREAVKRVLSDELGQLVGSILKHETERTSDGRPWRETDFFHRAHVARLRTLLEDARSGGVELQVPEISTRMGDVLTETITLLAQTFTPQDAGKLFRFVELCRDLKIKPVFWRLQTLYFELVTSAMKTPGLAARIPHFKDLLKELDAFMECRFVRLLTDSFDLS